MAPTCPPSSNNRSAPSGKGAPTLCGKSTAPPPAAAPCLRDRDGGRGARGRGLAARTRRRAGSSRPRNDRRSSRPPRPGTPAPPPPGEAAARAATHPAPGLRSGRPPGAVTSKALPRSPMAGPWRRTRGRGGARERAAAPASRRPSVRPFPGWRGRRLRARWGALTGDRSSPLHSSASLVCSRSAAPPFPPPRLRPPSSPGRRRGRRGSTPAGPGRAGIRRLGPPGVLNSRAPRCCVSASSWGPGPGRRSGGRSRAGPSGRARLAGAGGRRGPDGRGRQPDGQAAGAGLRDPLRRSRFPHKLPEAEPPPPSFLLPRPSQSAARPHQLRQSAAPPCAGPASLIRPSAPPPGLNQSEPWVGRPNAGGSTRRPGRAVRGSGGAWGEGTVPRVVEEGGFLCRLLGFSHLRNMNQYPMVTRPWSPNPLADTPHPEI